MEERAILPVMKYIKEKLKSLIEENKALKEEVHTLKTKVQFLEKQSKINNIIIIHGIHESENNYTELLELILEKINIVSKNANIDKFNKKQISNVRRLVQKNIRNSRPILITLTLAWRKVELLRNRKMFPKNIYATEDYPKEVLIKRKELKIQLKEEISNGKLAYIRYDKPIVKDKQIEKENGHCLPHLLTLLKTQARMRVKLHQ
ncbi:unnamed protein product [Pieris macdunnoughi]|uniref:Endonuclease-reverse transcriptase n=1 Tax=Pieris macdunnoughi TaxID=345717 RepID=A0A821NUK0_9NEOP|nr:unnamed protein product [Pieris macdunnoughi]